jgi:ABC-type lipoprotein export system ATPase subunit
LTWLFGTPSTQGRQFESTTFVQWLQSDDDLYWISGRPGSGKSTLMKFLCTHQQTKEHLKAWAKSDDVIVAEYFFWNAGKK